MEQNKKPSYSISFSEYSTYKQCPHKWFLNYQMKIPSDTNEELIFGSTLHDTIEELLTNKKIGRFINDENMIATVFKEMMVKQIKEIKDIPTLKKLQEGWVAPTFLKQGKALLTNLDISRRFRDYDVVEVEIQLDGMPIRERPDVDIVYKGFTDLILKHKKTGRYLILDWKSSRKKWDITAKEKDPGFYSQLYLYKNFYTMKSGVPWDMVDLCFYNLPREEPEAQAMYSKIITDQELTDFMTGFADGCEEMMDFDFRRLDKAKFTKPKNFCHRCPYNNLVMCNSIDQFQVVDMSKVHP